MCLIDLNKSRALFNAHWKVLETDGCVFELPNIDAPLLICWIRNFPFKLFFRSCTLNTENWGIDS